MNNKGGVHCDSAQLQKCVQARRDVAGLLWHNSWEIGMAAILLRLLADAILHLTRLD